jgi:hypothetical protein
VLKEVTKFSMCDVITSAACAFTLGQSLIVATVFFWTVNHVEGWAVCHPRYVKDAHAERVSDDSPYRGAALRIDRRERFELGWSIGFKIKHGMA